MTRVQDLMSKTPVSCYASDSLNDAAQLMWEHDCGCVPVVDYQNRVVGVITDRDVCMGAYTQGRLLRDIPVSCACSRKVHVCGPNDSLEIAEALMVEHQVRRLPVSDADGRLVGILSICDIARHMKLAADVKSNGRSSRALPLVMEAVSRIRDAVHGDEPQALQSAEDSSRRRPSARS